MEFDIVIPLGPDDHTRFREALPFTKKNIVGYRNIYIVAPRKVQSQLMDLQDKNVHIIDESIYPFDLEDLSVFIGPISRRGWYLQQLLKLYTGFVIPGILPRWLVIDADTFFLRPTQFVFDDKCAFNIGNEYMKQYFVHMAKLDPSLCRAEEKLSGVTHHMMFEAKYVRQLFEMVEQRHAAPFWQVFMRCVIPEEYERSGASEYEIYFNYMLLHHSSEIVLRPLKWLNVFEVDTSLDVDYISAHEWMHQQLVEHRKALATAGR